MIWESELEIQPFDQDLNNLRPLYTETLLGLKHFRP